MQVSTHGRKGAGAQEWAQAFADGFKTIGPGFLGKVRFRKAAALDQVSVAVIYDDWQGLVKGRVFGIDELNEIDLPRKDPAVSAAGIIRGDLVEPSGGGTTNESVLLKPLNSQFPGMLWIGLGPA